jgi:hypothetical protein
METSQMKGANINARIANGQQTTRSRHQMKKVERVFIVPTLNTRSQTVQFRFF